MTASATGRRAGAQCSGGRIPRWLAVVAALALTMTAGCMSIPPNATAVRDFDATRYLGKWYLIARLDHSFERGLEQVSAEYSLRPDGGIRVVNRGYDPARQRWREVEGRAYPIETPDIGRLKVSFFGPFYGAYNILDLAPDYSYALVSGPNRNYLWILARTPTLEKAVTTRLIEKARGLGFAVDQLIFMRRQD